MPQGKIGNIQEVIEQHVEKGVVALCAIFLIVAVGHWVLSSPRTTELYTGTDTTLPGAKTEQVSPADVGAKLLGAANKVKDRADAAEFDRPVSPDYLSVIEDRRGDPFRMNTVKDGKPVGVDAEGGIPLRVDTSRFMAILPPPQPREIDVVVEGKYFSPGALAQGIRDILPAGELPAPAVWAGRTLYEDGGQAQDAIVAHAVTTFPLGGLQKQWDETLKEANTGIRVVVAGVDVESQSRLPGGQWAANPVKLASVPVIIDSAPATPPEVPDYDGTNSQDVLQAVGVLTDSWQGRLLRPEYRQVRDPGTGDSADWSSVFPAGVATDDPNALWFHDESLRAMLEYRYRYRLRLVNPLLAGDGDVHPDFPDHARRRFIDTEWSPWSRAVGVERATEFFFTGAQAAKNSVNVTVSTLAKGQIVQADFKEVKPGQPIGGSQKADVYDPLEKQTRPEPVDFSTGAILVAIQSNAYLYQGATRFEKETRVIYLDQHGKLQTRLLKLDKAASASRTR